MSNELLTFRKYYDTLVQGIQDPEDLSGHLFAKNVISTSVRDEVQQDGVITQKRSRILINAVEKAITTDSQKFYVFVNVLRGSPYIAHLADEMEKALKDTTNGAQLNQQEIPPQYSDELRKRKQSSNAADSYSKPPTDSTESEASKGRVPRAVALCVLVLLVCVGTYLCLTFKGNAVMYSKDHEEKPSLPLSEEKPSVPLSEEKPSVPLSEEKPSVPLSEEKYEHEIKSPSMYMEQNSHQHPLPRAVVESCGLELNTKTILNEVFSKVSAKWKIIGAQLDLLQNELDDIESQMSGRPNCNIHASMQVIERWKSLQRIPYSWGTIIRALESPLVGEQRLATELITKCTKT